MAMNAYEIRYAVLTDARQMLMDQWMRACDHAQQNADRFSSGGIDVVNPLPLPSAPTMTDILKLANEMYEFVKTKD